MQIEETVYIKMGVVGLADEAEINITVDIDTDDGEEKLQKQLALYQELLAAKSQAVMLEFQTKFLTYLAQKYKDQLE